MNVLWLMSDQHNPRCTGYNGNPDVKTPNLDKIAKRSINFVNAFANNPICAPSRICFMTGQYVKNHQFSGNNYTLFEHENYDTLAYKMRTAGYQTALIGKAHMIPQWDSDAFEYIRYTDLCDADANNPRSCHYFDYLCSKGLGDFYEEGGAKKGQQYMNDGSRPSLLKYEDSIEHFTGDKTLEFLKSRDKERPFFIHMSFQRPHAPIAPSEKYFNMYDPEKLTLPLSHGEFSSGNFTTKSEIQHRILKDYREYPLAQKDEKRLRRCIASYYGLISAIDSEIGRIIDWLESTGELENTIIFYTADHGDFAGEHGLFHKNLGIYDSIQKIPFLLSYPGGGQNKICDNLVESVDFYPTICELCKIPMPKKIDGKSLIELQKSGKSAVFCEWCMFDPQIRISSIRERDYRLNYYSDIGQGELYDLKCDPWEMQNVYYTSTYTGKKVELLEKLLNYNMTYPLITSQFTDQEKAIQTGNMPSRLIHTGKVYWSELQKICSQNPVWPPTKKDSKINKTE